MLWPEPIAEEYYLNPKIAQLQLIVVVSDVDLVVAARVMNAVIVVVSDVDLVVAAEFMSVVIVEVSDVDLVVAEEVLNVLKAMFCLKTMVEEANLHLLLGIIFSHKK